MTNRYYSGPPSDHFDGEVFFNPGGKAPRSIINLLKWQFGAKRSAWPARWPSPYPPATPAARVGGDALRVTMVGHASLLIQVAGLNALTDPVWSERCSPVSFAGPKRVNAPGIPFERLPPIDLVLLSHNHYDHLDIDTLARLDERYRPLIVTPYGNDTIVRRRIPKARLRTGDWEDCVNVAEGVRVFIEPAHHWSARGLFDRRMALWASFVLETPAGRIYHIGDTGFHEGVNYRQAAARHGGFRLAILPIGAYEPRWFMKAQHQDPNEAVAGFMLCDAACAVGHHWGTFRLTNEPVEEPAERLYAALDVAGVDRERFRPLRPGEVWDVPPPPTKSHGDRNRLADPNVPGR